MAPTRTKMTLPASRENARDEVRKSRKDAMTPGIIGKARKQKELKKRFRDTIQKRKGSRNMNKIERAKKEWEKGKSERNQ